MRWEEPKQGEMRIRRKFLFRKRTLNGENRWLEFADIKELFVWDPLLGGEWREVGFADEDIVDKLEDI